MHIVDAAGPESTLSTLFAALGRKLAFQSTVREW
jgi:hypothetical protein